MDANRDEETRPRELLDDVETWDERYPEMPTVEVARQQEDPILWMKARDGYGEGDSSGMTFFVAGRSTDGIPTIVSPSGGSASIMTVNQFERGGATRVYGLMVCHQRREMERAVLDDDDLDYEGPGALRLYVDDSWQPRRLSEVVAESPGYKLLTDSYQVGVMRLHIVDVAIHRNGIGGAPFHVVLFDEGDIYDGEDESGRRVAVVFDEPCHCAVLDVEKLARGDIKYGSTSWRGDKYEPALREAIARWERRAA